MLRTFIRNRFYLSAFSFLLILSNCSSQNPEQEQKQAEKQLVWADEFDGSELDLSKWSFQIGDGCPSLCGWGNNELQWYSTDNHEVANGFLTITAREESRSGRSYTSTRIRTINKGEWTFGRFEMRAKLPIGQGIWPAFWMLPTDNSIYGTWAASGEIDIMEMVGHQPATTHGTIHFGAEWPNNRFTTNSTSLNSGTFNDDFHIFALEWESDAIRWYLDNELYATLTSWSTTSGAYPAPFNIDFHLLLNLAVGGDWPGTPDSTTVFPQEYVIDYIRVYQ